MIAFLLTVFVYRFVHTFRASIYVTFFPFFIFFEETHSVSQRLTSKNIFLASDFLGITQLCVFQVFDDKETKSYFYNIYRVGVFDHCLMWYVSKYISN